MNNLTRLLVLFSVLFTVFLIGPALLSRQFGPMPLLKVGDVFDLLTPLVLIPLYWLMLRAGRPAAPSQGESLVFLVFAACWVEGQGMHLAANSIGHLLKDAAGSQPYALTYFFDEVLSHYLWHFGIIGLSALLIYSHWRHAELEPGLAGPLAAGILHGLVYFITVVEAGTAPLGVPYPLLVLAIMLAWGRGRLRGRPLLLFFFITYLTAALFFAGWALYWGGLPQFSQVGIIE